MTQEQFDALRIWRLCKLCADTVQSGLMSPERLRAVAELLFGTAAQESNLRWERQRLSNIENEVGGFSKWQLEKGSISDSLLYLSRHGDVAARATSFLYADPLATTAWLVRPLDDILWAMRINDNDTLGVLFSRLHYLRMPGAIPTALEDQAAYYKRYYNTALGAATPEQYIQNWFRYCAPTVTGDVE